jgi:hypothetical protein
MAMAKVEVLLQSAVVVSPGDTLIVALNGRITMKELEELKARMAVYLPGVKVAVFDNANSLGVYKPERNMYGNDSAHTSGQ